MSKTRLSYAVLLAVHASVAAGCAAIAECPKQGNAQSIAFEGQVASTSLIPFETNLQLGDTATATAGIIQPAGCGFETHPTVTSRDNPGRFAWTSSNEAVLRVDSRGQLLGVSLGRANVTVKTADAASASFTVDVIPRVADVFVSPHSVEVHVGDTVRFDAYLMGSDGRPIAVNATHPYAVDLVPPSEQTGDVTNYLPGNPFQLVKRFDRAGVYSLSARTAVLNVSRPGAAVVTVKP